MTIAPTREAFVRDFRPIAALLDEIVGKARAGSSYNEVREALPVVERQAHLRRLCGSARWMIAADALVANRARFPRGFSVLTTDADHNSGRYAFEFPGGVWTLRREPHKEEEQGAFLQERLEGVIESAPLRPDLRELAVKVFVSIPVKGAVKVIAQHRAWADPVIVTLAELLVHDQTPVEISRPKRPRPVVRSTRREQRETESPMFDS
jgi:hypothetical protein